MALEQWFWANKEVAGELQLDAGWNSTAFLLFNQ